MHLKSLLAALSISLASSALAQPRADWLIDPSTFKAQVNPSNDGRELTLSNGLIRRTFRLAPNFATVAFDNLTTGQAELRSVRPEATVTIDGKEFAVGGLLGQPIHNYLLPAWLEAMTADPAAFTYSSHRIGVTAERFPWKPRTEWLTRPLPWPAPGVSLEVDFRPPPSGPEGVLVTVHYELFDGLPLCSKWITVSNSGKSDVRLNAFRSEIIAWVEPTSVVDGNAENFLTYPRTVHIETDFAFGGSMESDIASPGARWVKDPLYETQVHYEKGTPCLLECGPLTGPGMTIPPGGRFDSYRCFELLFDSTDRERRGLAQRRMYRALAPWSQENPLIFHAASSKPADVRRAVDQAAEAGFEMVIMTFGSGFDIENESPAYLAELKSLADYAHSKHIALGGYSLLASRSINAESDVVNPATGKPGGFARFGESPCIGSTWGINYFRKLKNAYEFAGLDVLEHDGSYPGDTCASTVHPGHKGLADSQWTQWTTITDFYKWCRGRGIYLNVPDWYFLSGSTKSAMGYRETNWSLPRAQQEIIERQNIYDGTWSKSPTMGWMFVPLTEYQGGGAAATIEPLDEHRDHYRRRLDNLLGAGVQACFRGPRLFDTPATRDMVKDRVAWFKANRAILQADIIHGRRPDGRDLDWILHADPALDTPALLVIHNPSPAPVEREISIDLYYTGLKSAANVEASDGTRSRVTLDDRSQARLKISVPAVGMAWYKFTREPK